MSRFREEIIQDRRIVVNCKTENQARELLTWAHFQKKTWYTGESYINNTHWDTYKYFTCYSLWYGEVGSRIVYATNYPLCILSYEEALLDEN